MSFCEGNLKYGLILSTWRQYWTCYECFMFSCGSLYGWRLRNFNDETLFYSILTFGCTLTYFRGVFCKKKWSQLRQLRDNVCQNISLFFSSRGDLIRPSFLLGQKKDPAWLHTNFCWRSDIFRLFFCQKDLRIELIWTTFIYNLNVIFMKRSYSQELPVYCIFWKRLRPSSGSASIKMPGSINGVSYI